MSTFSDVETKRTTLKTATILNETAQKKVEIVKQPLVPKRANPRRKSEI